MNIRRYYCRDPAGVQPVYRDEDDRGSCCEFDDAQEAVRQACSKAETLEDLRDSLREIFDFE